MNRAAVSIPEKLFFKIGEVCEITGVQAHVLRYWESEFPMLAPQKNRAGQRTYRKRDVEMVLRIKELLYEDQYTIAGAKKKLSTDIRGASKLKVVTPDMSAQAAVTTPSPALPAGAPIPREEIPHARSQSYEGNYSVNSDGNDVAERRAVLRRLSEQMRELLAILDSEQAHLDPRRR